jgi:hypothetical protein
MGAHVQGRWGGALPARDGACRKPWWVFFAGLAGLIGWSGWVSAQPLPPTDPSPAVQAVDTQIQQVNATLGTLSAQARQWQAQRAQAAAQLRQDEAILGQPTSGGVSAAPPSSAPMPSAFAVTRAS